MSQHPFTAALFVAVPVALGVLTLLLGWPRGDRYADPGRWRVGIALTALWLIGWPLLFAYLNRYDLQAAWLYPVILAPEWIRLHVTSGWRGST